MELNYEKDIEIDESALDVEWLNQARLSIRYAKNQAYWNDKVRRLEEKKKTYRSTLINLANGDPKGCTNKDKPNAADIEAFYRADDAYIKIIQELLDAEDEKEWAELAYKEISYTRKAALENLVKLHAAQYFAGPSAPRDLTYENQKKAESKEVDAGISRSMKRKK